MSCKHVEDFNNFQLSLIKKQAKLDNRTSESITHGWIEANSQTVRDVFCNQICPMKGECKCVKKVTGKVSQRKSGIELSE